MRWPRDGPDNETLCCAPAKVVSSMTFLLLGDVEDARRLIVRTTLRSVFMSRDKDGRWAGGHEVGRE